MRQDYLFENREDALKEIVNIFPKDILDSKETLILAVNERGRYMAKGISEAINSKSDILLTKPIVSEINPDLSIAMVGETKEIVMNNSLIDAFDIPKDYIYSRANDIYNRDILRDIDIYRDGLSLDISNSKFVILVDESIDTGLTMMTAVKTVIGLGVKRLFIAIPILDNIIYNSLVKICDGIFCPKIVDNYISIDYYFKELK